MSVSRGLQLVGWSIVIQGVGTWSEIIQARAINVLRISCGVVWCESWITYGLILPVEHCLFGNTVARFGSDVDDDRILLYIERGWNVVIAMAGLREISNRFSQCVYNIAI